MASDHTYRVGEECFFRHPRDSWVVGQICGVADGGKFHVRCDEVGQGRLVGVEDLAPLVDGALQPIGDLLHMPYLHDAALLHHIRRRYHDDIIYTALGPIVVALNPFTWDIPHYQDHHMAAYIAEGIGGLHGGSRQPVHCWSIAHSAYWQLRSTRSNQTILVTGESGAGKTEAVKIVLRYLAAVSTAEASAAVRERAKAITAKVDAASPIMEAFGNAKTLLNDNSSRFGKFVSVHFNDGGLICGCEITPYLLEKNRVVRHAAGERSYHSLYQLVAGASPADQQRWRLKADPLAYSCLAMGQAPAIPGVSDAEKYQEVRQAMSVVGMTTEEQDAVYRVCAAILHLTNVQFSPKANDMCGVEGEAAQALSVAAELLQIEMEVLLTSLTTRRTQLFVKNMNVAQAGDNRDALCKALYSGVFDYLIRRINAALMPPTPIPHTNGRDHSKHPEDSALNGTSWVGLLDIFGFEKFDCNSFEQLCINLTNERLQNHYTECIFRRDLKEYAAEGLEVGDIGYEDNQPTLDLLIGRGGLFELLDSECVNLTGTDANLLQHMTTQLAAWPAFQRPARLKEGFAIKHYAATVPYTIDGFREKNMDPVEQTLRDAVQASRCAFTRDLLGPSDPTVAARRGKKLATVGSAFCQSLQALMARISTTNPHWIRCVKPHPAKQPRHFSGPEVMAQLACAGVLDTIHIRRAGYAVWMPHANFAARYRLLLSDSVRDPVLACKAVLKNVLHDVDCQVGRTKVFLRDGAYNRLEVLRAAALHDTVVLVQRGARAALSAAIHLRPRRLRRQIGVLQAFARAHTSLRVRVVLLGWQRAFAACLSGEQRGRQAIAKDEQRGHDALRGQCRRGRWLVALRAYLSAGGLAKQWAALTRAVGRLALGPGPSAALLWTATLLAGVGHTLRLRY
eukprot:EG_transcript_2113